MGQQHGANSGPEIVAPLRRTKEVLNQEVENIKDVRDGKRQTIKEHMANLEKAGAQMNANQYNQYTWQNPRPAHQPDGAIARSKQNLEVQERLRNYKEAGVSMEIDLHPSTSSNK